MLSDEKKYSNYDLRKKKINSNIISLFKECLQEIN